MHSLTADLGIDDKAGAERLGAVPRRGSGGCCTRSAVMRAGTPTRHLDLDLAGQRRLKLVVGDGGDGNADDRRLGGAR